MKVNFNEETHSYTNECGDKLISTTQLLKLAGISPDYSVVNEDVLKAKADRGTLIHKEIEDYIKKHEIGFTEECAAFADYLKTHNISVLASERVVADKNIAGTIDLVLVDNDENILILADIKTTSTIHNDSVSWQCSIYKHLWEYDGETPITKLQVFHFDKNGKLKVKDIPMKSEKAITDLIEWYKTHKEEQFVPSVEIDQNELQKLIDAEKIIYQLKQKEKEVEEGSKLVRDAIIEAMKKNGVNKFTNDAITISYIAPTTALKLDQTKLKEEQPDIFNKYVKQTNVKESVRITLKGEKENDK